MLKGSGEALKGDEEAVKSDADAIKTDWVCQRETQRREGIDFLVKIKLKQDITLVKIYDSTFNMIFNHKKIILPIFLYWNLLFDIWDILGITKWITTIISYVYVEKNHKKDYFSVEILLKSKSSPPWGIYLDSFMTFYDDLIPRYGNMWNRRPSWTPP